jgi:hypothetical protein
MRTFQAEHKMDVLREAADRKDAANRVTAWQKLCGLFRRHQSATHDYSLRYWGHDYIFETINGGLNGHAMGWGFGLSKGDYLILQNDAGEESTK